MESWLWLHSVTIPNQAIAPHMMINLYSIKLSLNREFEALRACTWYCWSTYNNHYNSIRIYVRVTASHILCHKQKRSFLTYSIYQFKRTWVTLSILLWLCTQDMLLLINHSRIDKCSTTQFLYIIITSALPCCTVKTIIDTGSPFPTAVLALTVML